MKSSSSRRNFLAAGLSLPAVSVSLPAAGGVRYRTLGRTGLKICEVGFGCMVTSDSSVIARAVDLGVNHFDTARVYQSGNNEPMVGAMLKPHRQKVILSSKSLARDKAGALKHLDESLAALKTDYLDIWYLHSKNRAADITGDLLEAQAEAKKQGKIRFPGLSLHAGHAEVIPAVIATGKIDVVLLTYNFAMGGRWESQIQSLAQAGIGVIAMKVMAGSLDRDPSYDYAKTHELLKREGAPLAALKWVLRNPNVHCAIPSIKDADQLEENVSAMSAPFTGKDKEVLAAQLDLIRPLYCRMCGTCDGVCPKGMPVADVLRFLTYSDGYGEYALGRESFQSLPEEIRAVRCADCSACAVKCPNGVRVAQRLIRAQELFA
jgi:aryl-alcohol dehydrogenase-like predicted oxidoreductase